MNVNSNYGAARVARIELNSMLYSPVTWLVVFIFVCQVCYSFATKFDSQLHSQIVYGASGWGGITTSIFSDMFEGIFVPILRTLYLYIPLITMGLVSREYQSGSIKLLYSSPLKNGSIIFGKFLAMMVFGAALLAILVLIMIFCMVFIRDFDYPVVLSSLLGFYLLILAYSSIGIFMSSLTQYQVVAAIGTLALLAGLNYVGNVGQSMELIRDVTYWLSMSDRSYDFIRGLISSEDVIYYLLMTAFFLCLSVFKLNTQKTIMSALRKVLGYSVIVLATLALGYLSSRPRLKLYCDVTQDKENTLAPESRQIVERVKREKGDLKIISYVNILAQHYHNGLPEHRITDKQRFEKYLRFMPGLTMEYVLYYNETTDPSYAAQRFAEEGLGIKEMAERVCKSDKLDFEKILSPEEFREEYGDFSDEGHRLIRILEAPDGEQVRLRLYNDNMIHPGEPEISAAMGRFVQRPPQVGFYTTNPARRIDNYGDRGLWLFAHDKWFRSSLPNQGFDTRTIDPAVDPLDDIDILVVTDLREPASEAAQEAISKYIGRGGNMLISGDYLRSENMNPLGKMLGVGFSEGVLVEKNEYHSPDIVGLRFTEESAENYFTFENHYRWRSKVSANGAVALDCSEAREMGYNMVTVLQTSPDAWLEYETTDFVDGVPECNETAGERQQRYTALATLSRLANGREQRIAVSGDADIIANGELTASHPDMDAQNYAVIDGMFRWLSGDVYRVDVRHPEKTDNYIRFLSAGSRRYMKAILMWLVPMALLASGIAIILKRQRK